MTTFPAFIVKVAVDANDAVIVGQVDSQPTTVTFVDSELVFSRADQVQGHEFYVYEGTGIGEYRDVVVFTPAADVVTYAPLLVLTATSKYILFRRGSVTWYKQKLSEAVNALRGALLREKIDETLTMHDTVCEYALPSGFYSIGEVWRERDPFTIETCDTAWSESVAANVTVAADTVDYEVTASNLITVGGAVAAGTKLVTQAISALDLHKHRVVTLWIKSSVNTAVGDLELMLDDTAACASPLESIDIPALTANTWTRCVLTLANPESDRAIISIGLKYVTDLGACTIRIDDIEREGYWEYIPTMEWSIINSNLHFNVADSVVDNRRIRLVGQQVFTFPTDNTTAVNAVLEDMLPYFVRYLQCELAYATDWASSTDMPIKIQGWRNDLDSYRRLYGDRLMADGRKV